MSDHKPLGGKAYGSIPHLPGSRMGPADHHCHEGQRAICCEKVRDKHDRVIVTEKLDGSNVSVANVGGQILAIGRSGYLAATSPFPQHHMFALWVGRQEDRFRRVLAPGERIVGEWLAQAHGTRYSVAGEPFVPFDIIAGKDRVPFDDFARLCGEISIEHAAVIHDGKAVDVDTIMSALTVSRHGALDPVEGAVWRVEYRGKFDFIAKYVRPDKVDGALLPEFNGTGATVWNWQMESAI